MSIVIALTIWLVFITIFNTVFFYVTKRFKEIGLAKVALMSAAMTAVYALANFVTISFFTSNLILFGVVTLALTYLVGALAAKFAWQEKSKAIVYSIAFAVVFNLLWYKVLGVI